MSPLLASLALLALCWHPSAGVSWTVDSQNSVAFVPKAKQSRVEASIKAQASIGGEASPEALSALMQAIPNTMIFGAYAQEGVDKKLPFLVDPFINGIHCEFEDPTLPGRLHEIFTKRKVPSASDKEKGVAGMKLMFNIDCRAQPPTAGLKMDEGELSAVALQKVHECFCAEQKNAIFCMFSVVKFELFGNADKLELKLPQLKPCRDVTVPALLKAGSGVLGSQYNLQDFKTNNAISDAFSGNVDAFSKEIMKNLLCDAVDPEVEAAVRAVYASDVIYWITESLMYAMILGPSETHSVEMSMLEYCELEAVKADAYGRCLCKANTGEGTGMTFCIYKVIAEYFINEGHLTCDKADKTKHTFVAGRKPRSIPQIVKAPTGGAATSSLTIATLAAAALLLINH